MDKADSFMNWGFNPKKSKKSVDELYYSIYNYWSDEADTYQNPPMFKPFDQDPLNFLETRIKKMMQEMIEEWEGYFENYDLDILSGGARFPMDIRFFREKIECPFLEIDYDENDNDDIWNALYGAYPKKLAKEIMKSITNEKLQKNLKEFKGTNTILILNDTIVEYGDRALSLTVFYTKF